jgi:hypothetical protein
MPGRFVEPVTTVLLPRPETQGEPSTPFTLLWNPAFETRGKIGPCPRCCAFNLVEPHRCHRATADACVPTIESSLTPAGAAADDPRALLA